VKIIEVLDFENFISIFKDVKLKLNKNHYKKALINTIGSLGDWDVTFMDRYNIGIKVVNIFHYPDFNKVAFVIEKKNYDGFAELIATNRGAMIKTFFNKSDAINWLKT
jgi:hypothetical protein